MVKKEKVDMNTAFQNLYGVELEPYIYAEGIMNMFINFGILPNMKDNIIEKDALIHLLSDPTTYSKIIANPPFGADAKDFKEWYFQTIMVPTKPGSSKMKKKIVENPEAHFKLPFPNTNESAILFFQLIILKLKEAGKAGVVMSATILNDGYKDMMEWFLNCCSLEKVVINPAGTFKEQGTGIETFSFIFTKGKPTTTVEIVMLGSEDHVVRTLTLDQIKEAGYKLQLKEEEKKVVYTGVYELKKLGDIAIGNNGKGLGIEDTMNCPGSYPILSGGISYCGTFGKFNRDENIISLSKSGSSSGYVKWNNEKFWASDCFTVHPLNTEVLNNRFLYYSLSLQQENIYRKYQVGGTIPHCYWRDLENLQIPLPPLPIQQEIVANLDLILADPQDMKDCLAFTDKAMDLMLKDPTGKQLEDVLGGLRLKRAYLTDAASVKSQMAAVVRSVGARGFERKKLGDVCEFNTNIPKHDTHYGKETGVRPFYTGAANNKLFTDTPDIHHPVIIMNRTNGAGKCNLFIDTECAVAGQAMVFYMKNKDEKSLQYLYHYLNTFKSQVEEGYVGSNHKNISNGFMEAFEVKFPPLLIQHEVLAILNEMEAELETLEQMAAKAEQRAKFILDGYLTPQAIEAEPLAENVMITPSQTEEKPVKKRVFKVVAS
jgi:restriction endonuclease S subunit